MDEDFLSNGRYFDDDGTELNPDLIPKPNLCLMCKNNDDPSQEILCNLTRLDQRNEETFNCFAFIKRPN